MDQIAIIIISISIIVEGNKYINSSIVKLSVRTKVKGGILYGIDNVHFGHFVGNNAVVILEDLAIIIINPDLGFSFDNYISA
ncbi:MAG: hypothetical protein ACJARD_000801 [Alphaproteobacteria bacterium]|jgi:hypothetical protein